MKRTRLIPIEVLRVEDKILGSLNFVQVGLLALPLAAAVILLFLPPVGKLPIYKLALVGLTFAISGLLAVRLSERLILSWLLLITRYNVRPQRYISAMTGPADEEISPPPPEILLLNVEKFVPLKSPPPLVPVKQGSLNLKARTGNDRKRGKS